MSDEFFSQMVAAGEETLSHYGVLGMKWGHHKVEGVSGRTSREASKDAKEYARAKMFYGEGAGNRRKLIKATVDAKSKKDPSYQKAFEHHLANQDMSSHASAARGERKRKDVVNTTAKTARGIKNVLYGNAAYASTAAVVLVGAYGAAKKTGVDKIIKDNASKAFSFVKTEVKAQAIKRQFNSAGWGL